METTRQALGARILAVRKGLNKTQTEFGQMLGGIKKSPVSAYEKGDAYPRPNVLAQIAIVGEVSLDWLITGEDPAKRKGSEGVEVRKQSGRDRLIAQRAAVLRGEVGRGEENPATIGRAQPINNEATEPETSQIGDEFSMSEMVHMTIEVLESKTVYRSALASNVRAFHQAVKMEGEMQGLKEDFRRMEEKHEADMAELKQMIRSLGGFVPAQKRESTAGA